MTLAITCQTHYLINNVLTKSLNIRDCICYSPLQLCVEDDNVSHIAITVKTAMEERSQSNLHRALTRMLTNVALDMNVVC